MDIKLTTSTKVLLSVIALAGPVFWYGYKLLEEFGRAMGSTSGPSHRPWVDAEFRIIYLVAIVTIISLFFGFLLKGEKAKLCFVIPFLVLILGLVSNHIIGKRLITKFSQEINQIETAGRLALNEELKLYSEDFSLSSYAEMRVSPYITDYINIEQKTGDIRQVRVSRGGNDREKYILEVRTIGQMDGSQLGFYDEFWVEHFPKIYVATSKNVSDKKLKNVFLKDREVGYLEKVF